MTVSHLAIIKQKLCVQRSRQMVYIFLQTERQTYEAVEGKQNDFVTLGGGHLFVPATQNQNNHTETILFKTLLGPLALASYLLTLTY